MAAIKRFPRLAHSKISGEIIGQAHSTKGQNQGVGKVVITQQARGRIAERIIANELEVQGFGVIELNKNGNAPNADLVAISRGRPLQIQVKSATNKPKERSWVTYGYCTKQIIDDRSAPMFNRQKDSFYNADFVVLVAVRSPKEYRCFVLPVKYAEKAAQLHLDGSYRLTKWPPHITHLTLEPGPGAKKNDKVDKGWKLVLRYEGEKGWAHPLLRAKATAK